jgi:hypothetical protein
MQGGASLIWKSAAAQFHRYQQWLADNQRVLWRVAGIVLVANLLIFLLAGGASWLWGILSKDFAVVAGLAGGLFALIRHFQTVDADRQRRITESYSRAVEQLSSDKIEQRLGGIYTLERISKESPQDYWTVMENLTAFVRERTKAEWTAKPFYQRVAEHAYLLWETAGRPDGHSDWFWSAAIEKETLGDPPATNIAAVVTVIKRRSEADRAREARDERVLDFQEAVLRRANLREVHFERANLRKAHLEGADLRKAHLERADLSEAHLERASLVWAHLERANLREAHLERADLRKAHLEGADLTSVDGLAQEQIAGAFGDTETKLPEGLTHPAHWLEPKGSSAPAA